MSRKRDIGESPQIEYKESVERNPIQINSIDDLARYLNQELYKEGPSLLQPKEPGDFTVRESLPLEIEYLLQLNELVTPYNREHFVRELRKYARQDYENLRESLELDLDAEGGLYELIKTYLIVQTIWGHSRERHGEFRESFMLIESGKKIKADIQITPGLIAWVLFGEEGYRILMNFAQAIIDQTNNMIYHLINSIPSEEAKKVFYRYDKKVIKEFLGNSNRRKEVLSRVIALNEEGIQTIEERLYGKVEKEYKRYIGEEKGEEDIGVKTYVITSLALSGRNLALIPSLGSEKKHEEAVNELKNSGIDPRLLFLAGVGFGGIQDTWEGIRSKVERSINKEREGDHKIKLGGGQNIPLNLKSLLETLQVEVEYGEELKKVWEHIKRIKKEGRSSVDFIELFAKHPSEKENPSKHELKGGIRHLLRMIREEGTRKRLAEAIEEATEKRFGRIANMAGIFGLRKGVPYLREEGYVQSYFRYEQGKGISDEYGEIASGILFGLFGAMGTAVADLIDTISKFTAWNPSYDFDELMGLYVLTELDKLKFNIGGQKKTKIRGILEILPKEIFFVMAAAKLENGEGETLVARNDCSVRRLAEKQEGGKSVYQLIPHLLQEFLGGLYRKAIGQRREVGEIIDEIVNNGNIKREILKDDFRGLRLGFNRVPAGEAIRKFLMRFSPKKFGILASIVNQLWERYYGERRKSEVKKEMIHYFPSSIIDRYLPRPKTMKR